LIQDTNGNLQFLKDGIMWYKIEGITNIHL
jgi:hypothetical protein